MGEQLGTLLLKHGAWHVRYYADGKQKSKRLCDGDLSKKRVEIEFRKFMAEINSDGHIETPDLTVARFWETIYLPFLAENKKHSTVVGYQSVWATHLQNHFGKKLLKDYRTHEGSLFLTKLARTLRPRTLDNIKWLASSIFTHAVATGNCESNPWRDAKVLGKTALQTQEQVFYSLEQVENMISALVDHIECQLIVALAFFAGLRKGEIGALQWGDVDADFIHVRRAVVRGVVGTPKTRKSVRSIPIVAPLRIALNEYRRKARWVVV